METRSKLSHRRSKRARRPAWNKFLDGDDSWTVVSGSKKRPASKTTKDSPPRSTAKSSPSRSPPHNLHSKKKKKQCNSSYQPQQPSKLSKSSKYDDKPSKPNSDIHVHSDIHVPSPVRVSRVTKGRSFLDSVCGTNKPVNELTELPEGSDTVLGAKDSIGNELDELPEGSDTVLGARDSI